MRKYVIRRTIEPKKEGAKPKTKAPKIQRLITPQRLQRKRDAQRVKKLRIVKANQQKAEYGDLVAKRLSERKQHHLAAEANN